MRLTPLEQEIHHGVDGALLVLHRDLPCRRPAGALYAEMEVVLAVSALHLLELGVAADEIQPVLEMRLDGAQPTFDDQTHVNVGLPVGEIHLHAPLGVDGEVGLALLHVGEELEIELLALFDGGGAVLGAQAFAGVLVLAGQPKAELPVVTPLVDHGLVEDQDLVVAEFLLLDDHDQLPG